MKRDRIKKGLCVFFMTAAVSIGGCGNSAKATSMHLVKAEGNVEVTDGEHKDVAVMDRLGLYSGYQVGTRAHSYAWIDLDDVKLTKMDAKSEVEIQKTGKDLEIVVNSGSLFFNVTKPLEDDETMTIRTSNMMVGIRGTCGWVEVEDQDHMKISLLEGRVTCKVIDPDSGEQVTDIVEAGETGIMTAWTKGEEGSIQVEELPYTSVPDFVVEELEDSMAQEVQDRAGEEIEEEEESWEETIAEEVDQQAEEDDDNRRMALLNELLAARADGRAMYVMEVDMNRDGLEDLLFFGSHTYPGSGRVDWGFSACLWDGEQIQLMDLTNTPGDYIDWFGCSDYNIYRERATGDIYVEYSFNMDSVVSRAFVSVDNSEDLGYQYEYETEAGRADGAVKRQAMEAEIDSRFELLESLDFSDDPYDTGYSWSAYWNGYGNRPEDPPFSSTLDQVEQELMPAGMAAFAL